MRIILCDDDPFILQLEAEKIKDEIKKNQFDAEIGCITTNSKELFQYTSDHPGQYLFFIDLDFGQGRLNGIDLAKRIKQEESGSKIVFVTNHREMAMQVLSSGVEPFGFLEKTTDMHKLALGYRKYIQMALAVFEPEIEEKETEPEVCLTIGIDETIHLKIAQITYVEAEKTISHGITYHTADGSKMIVRDTMEHVLSMLGDHFLRCHRSVIVNQDYMIGLAEGMIRLSNGDEVPCSYRMKNVVRGILKQ